MRCEHRYEDSNFCRFCLRVRAEKAEAEVADLKAQAKEAISSFRHYLGIEYAHVEKLHARVIELEQAILRHDAAREGTSGERPDITYTALYKLIKHLPPRRKPDPT